MIAEIARLQELQHLDDDIARLEAEVAALPKRVAEIEARLVASKVAVDQTRHQIADNDKQRRSLENDIKDTELKIAKYKQQSQDVKTNEQYKALLHEIEYSQNQIRGFEDKILETMELSEKLDAALKAGEAGLKTQAEETEREKALAKSTTDKDMQELTTERARRNELRAAINSDIVDKYDRILKQRRPAIAEAREQKCTACFLLLRPQKFEEIKAGNEVLLCDQCSRILFYDPAHEPIRVEAPKKKAKAKPEEPLEEAAAQ